LAISTTSAAPRRNPASIVAAELFGNGREPSLGERIRRALESRIVSGEWLPGQRIPSEHELMSEYGCSRMTMNKVLSGMAAIGLITRRRRAGSFVAMPQGERAMMQIQDFATEARRRGQAYRHEILSRKVEIFKAARSDSLSLRAGSKVVRVRCLHWMNEVASAYEDRIISLASAPGAEDEPFSQLAPGNWLLQNVPWTRAEHVIRARNAGKRLGAMLRLPATAACLVLERRTWLQEDFVTEVVLTYPGDRHWFIGHFSPTMA
jgi:GntR family histidine utilization transcriptional repressor